MDKAPDAFRTISEVADDLDVPQHVLRFWETRFTQIKPMKRSGGRRYYRPDDVNLLRGIRRLLYGEGYTIRGVQRILREHGIKSVQTLADGPVDHASPLFDGPSFATERDEHASDLPEYEDADGGEEEELADETSQPGHAGNYASPLSLRDLGPPLTESAPRPLTPKAVQPAPANGASGAEAYAPPGVRQGLQSGHQQKSPQPSGVRGDGQAKLRSVLDDLLGARALLDRAMD